MRRLLFHSLLLLTCALPQAAKAGSASYLLRVECLPEVSGIFVTRHMLWGMHHASGEEIDKALAGHDLLVPNNFDVTCKLPEATYRIWGEQRKHGGRCGANPPIRFSMSRNGITLIDGVNFKDNCYENRVSMNAVEIIEHEKQFIAILEGEGQYLKLLQKPLDIAAPITQMYLDCKNPENWDEMPCDKHAD